MPHITVTTKRDGFRRAGRAWHGSVTVDTAELSKEQLAALEGEPMLIVTPAAAADGTAGREGKRTTR